MEKIIDSKVIFTGLKFEVKQLTIELSSGECVKREVVHKGGDSVAMLALDEDRNIYLVEEYFAAADKRMLCLPKGMIDPGEAPEIAAVRELEEEIGLTGRATFLTRLTLSPGYLTQSTSLFLVRGLRERQRAKPEAHFLETVVLPLREALSMVFDGKITEARTVAAIIWAASIVE